MAFLNTLYSLVQSAFLPSYCLFCRELVRQNIIFCAACSERIHPIASMTIKITQNDYMQVYAACRYQDPVKRLILAKGWSERSASTAMGVFIWERTPLANVFFDYLVPIPLHWTRFAWRGYNQAEVIASVLAKKSSKPMVTLLKRIKKTRFQSELSGVQRIENVNKVFRVCDSDISLIKNKHIMLVDDLMTTGSTLRSAAKTLMILQPASISAVVTCRII